MKNVSLKMTAVLFAAALMLGGCHDQKETNASASGQEESAASAVSEKGGEDEEDDDGLPYPKAVHDAKQAQELLLQGGWMYLDGTKFGSSPEKVVPGADKDAWYYGSILWFKPEGKGLVTIGGFDSTMTYTVNDDGTVEMVHGNPEMTEDFALGKDEDYGVVLYSITDENIRFYHETFE